MPSCPGINHWQAIRALGKIGFRVVRESRHVVMTNGQTTLIIPRNDPVNAFTMGGIILQAGLTVAEFRDLL